MVVLFERLAEQLKVQSARRAGVDLFIALASHPAHEERVRFFRNAAR